MNALRRFVLGTLWLGAVVPALAAEDRESKVRNDKKQVEADDRWIYNDLERGITEARQSGKPLLVVFRCIPCEACSEFDEQVVRRDPLVRDLMDRFVCVRIVQANGLDLTQFQFDYDQSFAAFLMNADRTIYGRFGTRSAHKDETQDMTIDGFALALAEALDWHKQYPANKALFAGKRGPEVTYKAPEDYPSLKGKYTSQLDYQGNVVKSCIHCHQVREAQRLAHRAQRQPIPDRVLYPYPLPDVVGLELDSKQKSTIKRVQPGSTAERDGFRAGDQLEQLGGQALLSIADVQWVLHNADDAGMLPARVLRDGQPRELTLSLPEGWRRRQDISWRPTTWDLRRMTAGGLVLEDLPQAERQSQKLIGDKLALRVKHVGQYGEHAVAKRAGFQKGDLIVALDDSDAHLTETGFMAHVLHRHPPGSKLALTVLRDGKQLALTLPVQ